MSKSWCDIAWDKATPYYNQIRELSFIKELMAGTLKEAQYIHYIEQDSIYLGEYGKLLAGIGAKLSDDGHRSSFFKFASDTVFVEQELHKSFSDAFRNNKDSMATPTCLLYTSFLNKQLATEPIEVAVAAALPCFVIYKKIGDYIVKNQSDSHNPYQKWINTYGGEDFAKAVQKAERITNELAEGATSEISHKMLEAYISTTKMEWMFWNSAYELEKWPL